MDHKYRRKKSTFACVPDLNLGGSGDCAGILPLAGVTLAEGCRLHDLTGVESLAGLVMAEGCRLYGLTAEVDISMVKAQGT